MLAIARSLVLTLIPSSESKDAQASSALCVCSRGRLS